MGSVWCEPGREQVSRAWGCGWGGGGEVAGTSRRKLASADPGSPLSTDCVSK